MDRTVKDPSQIKGWGVDADPKNDPTYPMKLRNDGEHSGYSWERPPQQPLTVEVLHSNERPDLTSVFGTSTPPRRRLQDRAARSAASPSGTANPATAIGCPLCWLTGWAWWEASWAT